MDKEQILAKAFETSTFSTEEMKKMSELFEFVAFEKGDYILTQNSIANNLTIVLDGLLRSFAIDPDGNEITTNFHGKGAGVLEVASFFLRVPTKENTQALSNGKGLKISFEGFQELFHSISKFREAARARLVNGFFSLKNRNLSMITDSAEERYLQLIKTHPQVISEAPLKYIASYLGITDTSLSRIRRELSKK
ncbi:MAG: Crp/Fnr family transcriptional regulator [Parasphingorhabdus sp.]